jgi:hypothetical protein
MRFFFIAFLLSEISIGAYKIFETLVISSYVSLARYGTAITSVKSYFNVNMKNTQNC